MAFSPLVDETDGFQVRVSKEGLLPVELALKDGGLGALWEVTLLVEH